MEKPDVFELDGSTTIAETDEDDEGLAEAVERSLLEEQNEDDEGLAEAVERSLLEEQRYRMRQSSTDIERDELASVIELSKIEK